MFFGSFCLLPPRPGLGSFLFFQGLTPLANAFRPFGTAYNAELNHYSGLTLRLQPLQFYRLRPLLEAVTIAGKVNVF